MTLSGGLLKKNGVIDLFWGKEKGKGSRTLLSVEGVGDAKRSLGATKDD